MQMKLSLVPHCALLGQGGRFAREVRPRACDVESHHSGAQDRRPRCSGV